MRVRALSLPGHGLKPQCKNILSRSPVRTGQDQLSHPPPALSSPFVIEVSHLKFCCFNLVSLGKLSVPGPYPRTLQVCQWLFASLPLHLLTCEGAWAWACLGVWQRTEDNLGVSSLLLCGFPMREQTWVVSRGSRPLSLSAAFSA